MDEFNNMNLNPEEENGAQAHNISAENPAPETETAAETPVGGAAPESSAENTGFEAKEEAPAAPEAPTVPTYNQGTAPEHTFAQQGYTPASMQGAAGSQYNPNPNPTPNPTPNPNFTVNASGEYRYIPPYTPAGVQNSQSQPQFRAPATYQSVADKAKKKKEKTKKTFSAGAVALIVAACVLLSFGAGMGGSILANKLGLSAPEENGSLVVYKNPENDDNDKNTSDKNSGGVPDGALDLSDVCAKVSESVVEIETEFKNTYGFYQYVNGGAGSGVIISRDGYVITNNHVIFNSQTNKVADSVTVRLSNSKEYTATVVGRDSDADIALLKVDAADLTPAVVGDSASLRVGESVIAVGNPLGKLGGTVTSGIVSATNREITVENNKMNLIQIDAAINPGNSGGGMFNMNGELVGIVNAKSSGSSIDGLGFAIPVNDAMNVVEELQAHGYVTGKTHIGVSLVDITDSYTAYYYFRSQQAGVYIAQVEEGFNSDVLKYGDRIISIDGKEVASSEDVKSAVKSHKVGDEMKFSLSREGKVIDVTVKCYEYVPGNDVTFNGETN